jgi:hypothetical protein
MGLKNRWMVAVFLILPALLWAEAAQDVSPDAYYQSALQAYLNGDMDQAILLDSKALQMNPQNQKAQALLTVLIGEKDTANKTVIWIGGKPATIEAAPVSQAPVTVVREKWSGARAPRMDEKKLQEVETRIQTIAFLLQRDSINQYKELTGAQVQTTSRLDEISFNIKEMRSGLNYGNLLFLLALIIACLALWNSWRTRQEMKRQNSRGRSDDSRDDRVVNLR